MPQYLQNVRSSPKQPFNRSSGTKESHLRALRELDVTVSRHPAPIVQPYTEKIANGQKGSAAYA